MKNIMIVAVLVIFITACKTNEKRVNPGIVDTTSGIIIADTIIYNVNIVNHNPDDFFGQQSLKGLKREQLLAYIFDMVYNGTATAYDHTSGEKMTPNQLKKLEQSDLSRNSIDMIQFREIWFINTSNVSMTKKVVSMVLGTQVFDSYGTFIANKAVLRVELGK